MELFSDIIFQQETWTSEELSVHFPSFVDSKSLVFREKNWNKQG